MEKISKAMKAVQGKIKVDLRIDNAYLADLHNGEFFHGSICIYDGIIVSYEKLNANEIIDANNAYLIPNYIDGHVHIESSMLSPARFAELVLALGTGTVIADPHEIANVFGIKGIEFMLASAKSSPLNVQMMMPSCVPALPIEDAGAVLEANNMEELFKNENILGLGEMMNVFGVVEQDESVMDKIKLAKKYGKIIDGHAPEVKNANLDTYVLAGIKTDHECITAEEVKDRLRRGMYVLIRESSAARNLSRLLPAITEKNSRYCIFCTDDRQANDIMHRGHINSIVKQAVSLGLDPITAIQMASLNPAECYGLKNKGSLSIGKDADFMLVDSIDANEEKGFFPHSVFVKGHKVVEDSQYCSDNTFTKQNNNSKSELDELEKSMSNSMNFTMPNDFNLYIPSGKARILKIFPNSLYTECEIRDINIDNQGFFDFRLNQGFTKIAVLERHKNKDKMGLGLLDPIYGLSNGAIASTINHDSHNLIVVGDNDADMFCALEEMKKLKGGIVMVGNGIVLESLSLELGGLMSNQSAKIVSEKLAKMQNLADTHFGIWNKTDAFMTLSFLALSVLPKFRITTSGLFDSEKFKFVDIDAAIN